MGSVPLGYLRHLLMEILSSEFPCHEVKGNVSFGSICHDAWCSGPVPLCWRAWDPRSKVQSKSNIAGSVTKPLCAAVYPYTNLTFLTFSLCEIMLCSPLPQPLKHTRSHTQEEDTPLSYLSQSISVSVCSHTSTYMQMFAWFFSKNFFLSLKFTHIHKVARDTLKQVNMGAHRGKSTSTTDLSEENTNHKV